MDFADLDADRLNRFKSMGFSPSCIFDVGASNGSWSWMAKQTFPSARFELFEPLARRHAPYREMLDGFRASGWNAQVHPVALGAHSGLSSFGVENNITGSSLLARTANQYFSDVISVQVTTIDDLVSAGVVPIPQLIKMDTQGAELMVLEGATRTLPSVDMLFLETWLVRGYGASTPLVGEIMNWLASRDFFLLDIGGCYRDPHGILTAQDLVFVNAHTKVSTLRGDRAYGGRGQEVPA